MAESLQSLTFAHSPDPDDAFMFYGFHQDAASVPGYTIEHYLGDIQSLNEAAHQKTYPLTAISVHAYPHVFRDYRIMRCGASMGLGYGPLIVGRDGETEVRSGASIAVPGEMTTAYLTLQLFRQDLVVEFHPFDEIMQKVTSGHVDYGVLIHEGQLTWVDHGLTKLVDLGEWWQTETNLPLPLGVDVVRRDLGESLGKQLSDAFSASIAYAFEHEDAAMEYARQWGRGIDVDVNRKFVLMYVNRLTRDMGEEGQAALIKLFERAVAKGLLPVVPEIDII